MRQSVKVQLGCVGKICSTCNSYIILTDSCIKWITHKDSVQNFTPIPQDAPKPVHKSTFDSQVGGNHYKNMKMQPIHYIHANRLGYIEGAVVKYISRYKNKNGKQDLEKIIEIVQQLIELEYPEQTKENI